MLDNRAFDCDVNDDTTIPFAGHVFFYQRGRFTIFNWQIGTFIIMRRFELQNNEQAKLFH